MIALIDADSLIYKVGFSLEDKVIWNELEAFVGEEEIDEPIYYADVIQSKKTISTMIENIMFAVDCDKCELWLTGKDNFRSKLPTDYKLHRQGNRKPELYNELKDYLVSTYNTTVANGYEADDALVMLKTLNPYKYVLCAIDKDVLYQSEGTHYNYSKDEYVTVTKKQAIRYAYYQILVGDASDGYKGCKGIGHVRATKILDEAEKAHKGSQMALKDLYWKAVVTAYESQGQTEDEAELQMQLANMHQLTDKGIVLWVRPKLNN